MKALRTLAIVLGALVGTVNATAQETDKIKLSPGMLLRVWPEVNQDMQKIGNEPSSAGVIDLGAEFKTKRISQIDPLSQSFASGYTAVEWSGYVQIEKDDTYVITLSKKQSSYNASSLHFFLKGTKVLSFPYGNRAYDEVKSQTLKLSAGYHPISFLLIHDCRFSSNFSIKIRSASELDSAPLKVTDFYFRKK